MIVLNRNFARFQDYDTTRLRTTLISLSPREGGGALVLYPSRLAQLP
jgi:hypothetical protein